MVNKNTLTIWRKEAPTNPILNRYTQRLTDFLYMSDTSIDFIRNAVLPVADTDTQISGLIVWQLLHVKM